MIDSNPQAIETPTSSEPSMPAIGMAPVPEQSLSSLMNSGGTLSENLEKREEALKRLRELTLGQ